MHANHTRALGDAPLTRLATSDTHDGNPANATMGLRKMPAPRGQPAYPMPRSANGGDRLFLDVLADYQTLTSAWLPQAAQMP